MKKGLSTLFKVIISFGLLGGLFWFMRKDAKEIVETLITCDLRYLSAALVFFLINAILLGYRLQIIFAGENLKVTFWEAFQLNFIGYFFNNFMPTSVGGDLMKAHCASNYNQSRMRSYASVMMDRIIGLYAFLIVAAVALMVDNGRFKLPLVKPLVFLSLVFGSMLFVVLTSRRVAVAIERFFDRINLGKLGENLESIYKIVHDYRNRLDVLGNSLFVSLISLIIYFVTIYLFFASVGSNVSLGNIFLVMPVVTFISMIPSIGGLGVREGAMLAFFSPVAGREKTFAVSLLLLFGLFLLSLLGGALYLHWSLVKEKGGKKSVHKQRTSGHTRVPSV